MRIAMLAGLCVLLAIQPCFAEWPIAPAFDPSANCPQYPSHAGNWSDWESYRQQLDQFLNDKLEAFWTFVNTTYRVSLERQRETLDSELNSRKITLTEYKVGLDQYRAGIAKINTELHGLYELGVHRYREGIGLYETAMKRLGEDASTD